VIHYHGTPITPETASAAILAGRHAMVSFAHPEQIDLVADVCQSFSMDCGAYGAWRGGEPILDWKPYYGWIGDWFQHPGFDFALIPDVIDGDERQNDALVAEWPFNKTIGCPVWHLHESVDRLKRLCDLWPRVAIGSSGEFAQIGKNNWWVRMGEALNTVCPFGRPLTKLHGLRMLDPKIFGKFPFASADSTNVARNIKFDQAWTGAYQPNNLSGRGVVLADRIEAFNSSASWVPMDTQRGLLFDGF
jgi:hypothetical protein